MAPTPKARDRRQNRIKRPELGIVPSVENGLDLVPDPPRNLLAATRRRWVEFWSSPLAAVVDLRTDRHRIERWIRTVDELERVQPVFVKARLVKGSMGQPVLNPLSTYIASLHAELSKAEADLGLTPLARLKLGITYGEAMMTAAQLNEQLDGGSMEQELEPWGAEWQEA